MRKEAVLEVTKNERGYFRTFSKQNDGLYFPARKRRTI